MKIEDEDFPGLYQAANRVSMDAQVKYYRAIASYLILLISAATFAYLSDGSNDATTKIVAAVFFLVTLSIVFWLRFAKPDDIWYNGRAVAESVKTRAWRWMMGTDPYSECENADVIRQKFVRDLKAILRQNESLGKKLCDPTSLKDPISNKMIEVRGLPLQDRAEVYRTERIDNQAAWYSNKAIFNQTRANRWFLATIALHAAAILLLLYNIKEPQLKLPIEVIAGAASSVLTWIQSKKHNELASSYSLTAHEIILIKGEKNDIRNEEDFSEYIINCENAFSREHTQWVAKKSE